MHHKSGSDIGSDVAPVATSPSQTEEIPPDAEPTDQSATLDDTAATSSTPSDTADGTPAPSPATTVLRTKAQKRKAAALKKKEAIAAALNSRSPSTGTPSQSIGPRKTITSVLRIETRWAPADYKELWASRTKMFERLAPILSCFNTEHTWMMEWQADQMDSSADLDPTALSKYLSIRFVPVAKQQCFYFSFRINGSGNNFSQVTTTKVLTAARQGENLTFDPSSIPSTQGELTNVGDILLKDASLTQRANYLQYLRKHVLPEDMPTFDLKRRFKDPIGNLFPILTVRSGKSVSTRVAELLSIHLDGNPEKSTEVFI